MKYKFEDIKKEFKPGEEVLIKHSVLNRIEHESRGVIKDISNKKLTSGIIKLQQGEDKKHLREIPIIYIKSIKSINKAVDKVDKYKKLTEDLIAAKEKAEKESEIVDDGGTANLDSTFLVLPRWKEEKVLKAIKDAGMYCRCKTKWIGTGYFLSVNCGQGNRNTVGRNIFARYLQDKGYKVIHFDKMD